MDVEKLKKVNQLATTLRDKGLADGREEAAMLAGRMNYGQGDSGMEGIFSEPKQEQKETPSEEKIEPEQQPAQQMDEKKIINILQNFADQFSKEVNALSDKMREQEQAMQEMAAEIKRMKSQSMQGQQTLQTQQQPQQTQAETQTQSQAQQTQSQPEQKQEKPRSGSYESDDVSIEKFFYFGTN